jgi:hypothetical protein
MIHPSTQELFPVPLNYCLFIFVILSERSKSKGLYTCDDPSSTLSRNP